METKELHKELNEILFGSGLYLAGVENNEIKFIRTDNISFVVFYAKNSGKRNVENKPTLQIFDNEQKMLVEMTVKIMDYHLLKKYFTKFNVSIKDQYNRF